MERCFIFDDGVDMLRWSDALSLMFEFLLHLEQCSIFNDGGTPLSLMTSGFVALVLFPRILRSDEKDKKIQELTAELRNKKRLCAAYQEQLTAFMKVVEEHSDQLSKKVKHVINNLKEFESIEELLQHR
ncbi:hypothetical protein QYF36_004817 [Acer negundo]|nr:hypothetical protein QYF36_004817 [Acer negundo]